MPVESVALLLDLPADIRVAIGRPATALDGFRRTHVDALTNATDVVSARFVLAGRTIRRHPTRGLDDNRSQSGGEFVADILGHFVGADEDLTKRFQEVLKYGRASGVQLGDYGIPQCTRSLLRKRDSHQQHRP